MRLRVLLPLALVAAACVASDTRPDPSEKARVERAIVRGDAMGVGQLDARRADCRPYPDLPTAWQCRVDTNRNYPTFLMCDRESPPLTCAIDGAPDDVSIFTTPELGRAPKDVVWKCEDEDEAGRVVGPAFVSLRHAPAGYPAEEHGWMTRADAEELARRLRARFYVDC